MQSAKTNITKLVDTYIKLKPEEFDIFKEGVKLHRNLLIDEEFGIAKGSGSDMRALFEMPVDLHEMLIQNLSEEEMEWFKAGGKDRKQGAIWFAKTFPAFALPKSI